LVFIQHLYSFEVPHSLREAEIMLSTNEIDTTYFENYEKIVLDPINPIYEGWRRFKTLVPDLKNFDFPTKT
jgi:hypothetical protein